MIVTKDIGNFFEDNQPSRLALLVTSEDPEDVWERTKKTVKRIHQMPRQQLYLPLDLHDCPIEPRYFKDTTTTFMKTVNDDGSTSETLIRDSWRCLSDASDARQEKEWIGYTEFQISSRYFKGNDSNENQTSSTFSLAVIRKPLKTGKETVDIFDDVVIRNERCKTDKRICLKLTGGGYRLTDGQLDLDVM